MVLGVLPAQWAWPSLSGAVPYRSGKKILKYPSSLIILNAYGTIELKIKASVSEYFNWRLTYGKDKYAAQWAQ
jgi:hypothetical protein